MTFNKWLDALVEEKNVGHKTIEVEGESGLNIMPMEILVDAIKSAPKTEQAKIKNTLVAIDFKNGDVMHFFNHLAKAIAV